MLHSRGELLLMLDADGATKVNDLEKLENQVCISWGTRQDCPILFFCKSFSLLMEIFTKTNLCLPSRSKQLQERNLNQEIQHLVIQVLVCQISQFLHLVLVLILRIRPWLQFSFAFNLCFMLKFYFYLYFSCLNHFTFVSEEVVPQFFDEGFPSCGSFGSWSWNPGYTGKF